MTILFRFSALVLFALTTTAALAVRTQTAAHVSYETLAEGELTGVALTSDGQLSPARSLEEFANLEAALVWDAAWSPDGSLYLATGNPTQVVRVTADGTTEVVFESEEALIRAIAVLPDGDLLAGTSPRGRIYRIRGGDTFIFFDPPATYLWDIALTPAGAVLVATGLPASLYRLSADFIPGDEVEPLFTLDQDHLTALAVADDGSAYAGSSGEAILYAIEGDKARALYQAQSEEVRQIAPAPDGGVYFATFQGDAGRNASSSGGSSNGDGSVGSGHAASAQNTGSSNNGNGGSSAGMLPVFTVQADSISGGLLKATAEGFVEPFWSAPTGGINAFHFISGDRAVVAGSAGSLLYSVDGLDNWARLGALDAGGDITLLLEDRFGEGELLLVASHPGKIFRLASLAEEATYTGPVVDAGQIARWGNLSLATAGDAQGLTVQTRTGNTAEPDDTWSDWTDAPRNGRFFGNASPVGRYLEYQIVWTNQSDAGVRQVTAYYQLPNAAPLITQVNVVPVGIDVLANPNQQTAVDLNKLFSGADASEIVRQSQQRQILRPSQEPGRITIAWRAGDPNNDHLLFDVYLQELGADDWLLLGKDIEEPLYSMQTRGMEDGFYRVEVVASDRPDNPDDQARTARAASGPFLLDQRPPEITTTRTGASLLITATDNFSVIADATVTIDGENPRALRPEDGLFDSTTESLRLDLSDLSSASILLEITDENGNAAKVTVRW